MANLLSISERTEEGKQQTQSFQKNLARAFQSANINFLLGSGASCPAIQIAGKVEQEIEDLFKDGSIEAANKKMYEFLEGVQKPTNQLIRKEQTKEIAEAIDNYKSLIQSIQKILIYRKTNLLSKQANIFTTNYDLLIEKAAEGVPTLKLNDGFARTPNLHNEFNFSSQNFFNSTFNIGNLYNYKVEIPALNLIKTHGSLSWRKEGDQVLFSVTPRDSLPENSTDEEIQDYINKFAVVLPQVTKFQETLMVRVYYDLLRIFSNELDKESTLLIVFGFSFADAHIYDITKRALKNPALKLEIFSYSHDETQKFAKKFNGYNNVDIIGPLEGETIDFPKFNRIICNILPTKEDE